MSNTDDDQCAVATNAAMEVAMDECSPEDLLTNLGRMVGLTESPDPRNVPDEPDPADCMDMDVVREWIAVRARDLIDAGVGMSDAIEQAWAEASENCGW